MNKTRTTMKLALGAIFFADVYVILRGSPYIAEVSWIILIGVLSLGVIIFGSKVEHAKEVRA